MSGNQTEFLNPDGLPVENVMISVNNEGVVRQIKALDPHWVDKRQLTLYEPPPFGSAMIIGAADAWRTKMKGYLADLKWLLSLEHHRFWSTILYHSQCMDSLVSFLQEASPPYLPQHESKEVRKLYNEIRKHILIVFSRLITNKESKTQWMTKEYMADVIYNNFVFTIPILWDICLVYGVDNKQHVSRLVNSVFTLQSKYEDDAAAAVAFVKEAFKYIILQVNKNYDSIEPPNLPETFKGFGEIRRPSNSSKQLTEKITFSILRDLVVHLLDTAMTLRIFVEVYPKSVKVLRKTNFVSSIVQLYEYGIPQLYEKLEELGDPISIAYSEVEGHIDLARAELIDIFREILAVYKNAIFSGEGNVACHAEDYLEVMMEGLAERLLIRDHHASYPVHEDIDMLRQACPDIDSVKTDFILQAIYSNMDEPVPEHLLSTNHDHLTNGYEETIDNAGAVETIDNNIPDKLKEESLISEVKDILPHLGDGFILKCLQHYGFNSETVINRILEGSLDESLKDLDKSLPIIPEDPLDQKFLETGIARLNVFDGDEFDIMNRDDVDTSRMHRGKKKSKYKDLSDMLDDKREVKKLADLYSKYNLVCDEENMYSDEYDDTYDSESMAPPADITPDEVRRPFVTPRALRTKETSPEDEESEEESDVEEAAAQSRSRMDFCANPEELRARREQAFQMRRGKGQRPPPARTTDVVGKPKGQGQEKEVLVSRDRKEKHKSSRANHNRRGGAQWKRSQGMVPS